MEKCAYYYRAPMRDLLGNEIYVNYVCRGKIEPDHCTCEGDLTRCDFYPEKREAALNEELAEKFGEFCKEKGKPTNVTTIYYAHHQWKYGTKIEEYELDVIKRYFPHAEIFNPATELKVEGRTEEDIMDECIDKVLDSDIVIFTTMDSMIGIGVYREVTAAQEKGKLVLCLAAGKLHTVFVINETPEFESDRLYAKVCVPMY